MRFVLCDEDHLYASLIELMLNDQGHEVVGVASTTSSSVALVMAARPDVVIVDLSLGLSSDFDVVAAAASVGAWVIAFSHSSFDAVLSRHRVRPTVVHKPDLTRLERVVSRLGIDAQHETMGQERRQRPGRGAAGPEPTGIGDSQAFYEALNEACAGDALVSIELTEHERVLQEASDTAIRVRAVMRASDRLLTSPRSIRVFLPAGGGVGAASFHARLIDAGALADGVTIRSVVIATDESAADAFDRLKTAGPP